MAGKTHREFWTGEGKHRLIGGPNCTSTEQVLGERIRITTPRACRIRSAKARITSSALRRTQGLIVNRDRDRPSYSKSSSINKDRICEVTLLTRAVEISLQDRGIHKRRTKFSSSNCQQAAAIRGAATAVALIITWTTGR